MKNKNFGAFLQGQISATENHTCVREGKSPPELKYSSFSYFSGGSFSKTVRCLPNVFIIFAMLLIAACSGGGGGGGGGTTPPPGGGGGDSTADINTYTLEYKPDSGYVQGKATIVIEASTDIPPAAKVSYTIPEKTDSKITIDSGTGKITVNKDITIGNYPFTVTATPDPSTDYTGTKTASVTILITDDKDLRGYNFAYDAPSVNGKATIVIFLGESPTINLKNNNIPTAAQVTYAFTPSSNGISINSGTGVISITNTVQIGTYDLTVVASSTSGYRNTSSANVIIRVRRALTNTTLSYDPYTGDNRNVKIIKAVFKPALNPPLTDFNFTIENSSDGITIDTKGGDITIAKGASGFTGQLSIKATVDADPYYSGGLTANADIKLTALKNISKSRFEYKGGKYINTADIVLNPIIDGDLKLASEAGKVTYTINSVSGTSIDGNSGIITIVKGTTVKSNLTVTAKVSDTDPVYIGTHIVTFDVDVNETGNASAPGAFKDLTNDVGNKIVGSLKVKWTPGTPGLKPDGTAGAVTVYDVYAPVAGTNTDTVAKVKTNNPIATDITGDSYLITGLTGGADYNVVVVAKNSQAKGSFNDSNLVKMTSNGVKKITIVEHGTNKPLTDTLTLEAIPNYYIFKALIEVENILQENFTWSTDNTEVATITNIGALTIIKAGTVTVTATSVAQPSRKDNVIVTIEKKNISTYALNYTKAGSSETTFRLGGGLAPVEVENKIPAAATAVYTSSNSDFTVDPDGTIKGTNRTADSTYDNIKITATVPSDNPTYKGSKVTDAFTIVAINAISITKPDPEQSAANTFFTVGDINNPSLVEINANKGEINGPKITIKNGNYVEMSIQGSDIPVEQYGNKTTMGLNLNGFTYAKFENITDNANLTIEVEVTINKQKYTKTYNLIKKSSKEIYTWRDLKQIDYDFTGSYTLMNTISFPEFAHFGYSGKFIPIGSVTGKFSGKFNGNHHEIKRFKLDDKDKKYQGLFAYVSGTNAEVKDLVIDHVGITGLEYVGAVAGKIDAGAKILNVGVISSSGSKFDMAEATDSTIRRHNIGSLVGEADNGEVSGYATGAITVVNDRWEPISSKIGGLVGSAINNSKVYGYTNVSINTNSIDTNWVIQVGGLVGYSDNSNIYGYAIGNLVGYYNIGGLVGHMKKGQLVGYARGNVLRSAGVPSSPFFGKIVGNTEEDPTTNAYHSAGNSSESQTIANASGAYQGDPMSMTDNTAKNAFGLLSFGNSVENWVWIENGRWPAIVIDPSKNIAGNIGQRTETQRGLDENNPCFTDSGSLPTAPHRDPNGYQISTEEHLIWMQTCASGNFTYNLQNNINLTQDWKPIGTSGTPFIGVFDGRGYTISNLKINESNSNNLGLFGFVQGSSTAEIKNIVVDHAGIRGDYNVGAIAGQVRGSTKLTNVSMKSSNNAEINGTSSVGGLVGLLEDSSTLYGHASGAVKSSNKNTGGLVGVCSGKSRVGGYATGAISGVEENVGGMIGKMTNCSARGYATGSVGGKKNIGGLIGFYEITDQSFPTDSFGYATGTVTVNNSIAGGLVGQEKVSGLSERKIIGYARNKFYTRNSPLHSGPYLGKLKGLVERNGNYVNKTVIDEEGYHSEFESTVDGLRQTGTDSGYDGKSIDNSGTNINQSQFGNFKFNFSSNNGEWLWEASGRWPAINLSPWVGGAYSKENQPTR